MNVPLDVRFVLDKTTHPGNIGAAARAIKVMGFTELHLVAPSDFPDARATAMASSAHDVLESASVHRDLDTALAGCTLILGTTARLRSVAHPTVGPREAAQRIVQERGGPVAVLFGTEKSGLSNDAMARCHVLVNIPTGQAYQSLNLAQAVQILAYELRMAIGQDGVSTGEQPEVVPAPDERMQILFAKLEQTLADIRYSNPGQTRTLMYRLRRLFLRARPDDQELNMLMGILTRASRAAATHGPPLNVTEPKR